MTEYPASEPDPRQYSPDRPRPRPRPLLAPPTAATPVDPGLPDPFAAPDPFATPAPTVASYPVARHAAPVSPYAADPYAVPAASGPATYLADPYASGPFPTYASAPSPTYGGGPFPTYAPGPPASGPARPPMETLAVVALATAVLGILIVSVPTGIVALVRTGRSWVRGRSLAIVALVLSLAWIVVIAAVFAFRAGRQPTRAPDGTVLHQGATASYNLRVGDCVKVPAFSPGLAQTFGLLNVVPCTVPHNGQVFAVLNSSDSSYPGQTAMTQEGLHECALQAVTFLGTSTTTLEVLAMVPTTQLWGTGERGVQCLLVDGAEDITGDIRDHS